MINIIGRKNLFLGISVLLIVASIIVIAVFGFREGIDFKGGTMWQFKIETQAPTPADLENFLKTDAKELGEFRLNHDETNNIFLVRFGVVDEASHQGLITTVKNKYPSFSELSFESIGPSIGAKLRQNAIIAIILVLVGISLYIAFAFRKTSRPVSSWKYGFVTLLSLFHDIIIPAGLLAILSHIGKVEMDSNFIVALLVVMGFSVHDTIVVFDRIRENIYNDRGKTDFGEIVNLSVNQTMARSINTSLTLILVLLAMYFAGPVTLKYFILTLLVGVTSGTYSSIFMASPMLVAWQRMKRPAKA